MEFRVLDIKLFREKLNKLLSLLIVTYIMIFRATTRLTPLQFLALFGRKDNEPEEKVDKENATNQNNPEDLEKYLDCTRPNDFNEAVTRSKRRVVSLMTELGIPGMTIAVSKKGKVIWEEAFGFCDVENQVQCERDSKMRIASISKALFASTVVAPMIEEKKIDLKSSIHKYLTHEEFPKKTFQGEEKDITIEQLLSHTSGISHYSQDGDVNNYKKSTISMPIGSQGSLRILQSEDQYNRRHFYQRQTFRSVIDALEPFKDAPLFKTPGEYNYTTYGYTLLSAVVERVHQQGDEKCKNEQIEDYWMKTLRRDWDMSDTSLDQDEPILSKRARYYLRSGTNGRLVNAPYTDNSIKWAGGGIISTTEDLLKFANHLINSYKGRQVSLLKKETIDLLWKEIKSNYGLGFCLMDLKSVDGEKVAVYHLGSALGASSGLIIFPESEVAVVILTNLGDVNVLNLGLYVAKQFATIKR